MLFSVCCYLVFVHVGSGALCLKVRYLNRCTNKYLQSGTDAKIYIKYSNDMPVLTSTAKDLQNFIMQSGFQRNSSILLMCIAIYAINKPILQFKHFKQGKVLLSLVAKQQGVDLLHIRDNLKTQRSSLIPAHKRF